MIGYSGFCGGTLTVRIELEDVHLTFRVPHNYVEIFAVRQELCGHNFEMLRALAE